MHQSRIYTKININRFQLTLFYVFTFSFAHIAGMRVKPNIVFLRVLREFQYSRFQLSEHFTPSRVKQLIGVSYHSLIPKSYRSSVGSLAPTYVQLKKSSNPFARELKYHLLRATLAKTAFTPSTVNNLHYKCIQPTKTVIFSQLLTQLVNEKHTGLAERRDIKSRLMRMYLERLTVPSRQLATPCLTTMPKDILFEILSHLTNGESKKKFFDIKERHKKFPALFTPIANLAITCRTLYKFTKTNSWENGIPLLRFKRLIEQMTRNEKYEYWRELKTLKIKKFDRCPALSKIKCWIYTHKFSKKEINHLISLALGFRSKKHINFYFHTFNVDVNTFFKIGRDYKSPLIVAAQKNDLKLIQFFLKHGANSKLRHTTYDNYPIQETNDIDCILALFETAPEYYIRTRIIYKVIGKLGLEGSVKDIEILTKEIFKHYPKNN